MNVSIIGKDQYSTMHGKSKLCSGCLLCGARDDVIKQLERVQQIAARVVYKKHANHHSSVMELLWGLHWLPINTNYYYLSTKHIYRYPSLRGSLAYTKVVLQDKRTLQKVNILNVPAHGK